MRVKDGSPGDFLVEKANLYTGPQDTTQMLPPFPETFQERLPPPKPMWTSPCLAEINVILGKQHCLTLTFKNARPAWVWIPALSLNGHSLQAGCVILASIFLKTTLLKYDFTCHKIHPFEAYNLILFRKFTIQFWNISMTPYDPLYPFTINPHSCP